MATEFRLAHPPTPANDPGRLAWQGNVTAITNGDRRKGLLISKSKQNQTAQKDIVKILHKEVARGERQNFPPSC